MSAPQHFTTAPSRNATGLFFILGHLEAFDWNLLREPLGLSSFDPDFDKLFAFGIDPVEGGLPTDQPKDWPSIDRVRDYNKRLREQLDAAIRTTAAKDPSLARLEHGRLLEVAIEHRLMHAETLCYMLHQLPVDRKFSQPMAPPPPTPARGLHCVEIPAGTATLGLARSEDGPFGWDNEFEEHRVEVPAFAIDAYNVTNGDYLRFVREGGYEHRALWSDSGWEWITSQEHRYPSFWIPNGDSWRYRTMFAEISLPLDWPVYVSHDEASAYARWAGKELPSEAEWHRAAYGTRSGSERAYPWGAEAPAARHGNFDFERWDPVPAGSYPGGQQRFRRRRSRGEWLGMDAHAVCALSRVPAIFVLSRVFREFLRREALRDEGRFAAHGRMHAAAVVPQLVPAALPVRVRDISLRRTLTRVGTNATQKESRTRPWLPR